MPAMMYSLINRRVATALLTGAALSLAACGSPEADIKDLKSLVQVTYGQKKFKESAGHAAKGLKLATGVLGPKHPDTLYFAQALTEAYVELNDKKGALGALNREIELRLGAGQGEPKVQARRTLAIKLAEETGDKATAVKHAVAISKSIAMDKDKDPQPVYRTETKYPVDLFNQGVEGDVTVSYSLDETGAVTSAKVIKSKPSQVFDRAALESFKAWRFTPVLENGQPIAITNREFTLMFRLGGRNLAPKN